MNIDYHIIDVSWDYKYLRGRPYPQSVRITTSGLLDCLKEILYEERPDSLYNYYQSLPSLLNGFPEQLHGELDYKNPLDFMGVYYTRPGMVACVSNRVKSIFDTIGVNPDEYILKPITIKNQSAIYYVLFIPMIPISKAGIDFSTSVFSYAHNDNEGNHVVISNARDYLENQADYVPQKIVLEQTKVLQDIYHIESCSNIFYSSRIVEAFKNEHISGAKIFPLEGKCKLVIKHS